MKKLLATLLILIPFICSARELDNEKASKESSDTLYNFQIVDKKIQWQNIYTYSGTYEELKRAIFQAGKPIEFEIETSNSLTGKITLADSKFRELGKKWGTTVIQAQCGLSGLFTIDYKDGKYRVTVYEIILRHPSSCRYDVKLSDVVLTNKGEMRMPYGNVKMIADIFEVHNYNLSALFKVGSKLDDW